MPNELQTELLSINYTNNYVELMVKVPITFMQTLQRYGLLKTPLIQRKN